MKTILGIKIGGLQQKIFNLVLLVIIAIIGAFIAVNTYQQNKLTQIVQSAGVEQQEAIEAISAQTMAAVLETSMSHTTALQAYIANDLFSEVKTDVLTLRTVAEQLFEHMDSVSPHPYHLPDAALDGIAAAQVQTENGVDPASSRSLDLVANMSEMMLAMFRNSEKLSSCFVATADGCILYVDDRSGSYFDENGDVVHFDVRSRPWYLQAAEEGELIFTGVELDAFTDIPGLVCAAPVYKDGELVAVVGADIFLTAISDYVKDTASEGGFVCVISDDGQVLFSPVSEGVFRAEVSEKAADLRKSGNGELAAFISLALKERTPLELINVDGRDYYLAGAPLQTLGWTVVSVVEKELTDQPAAAMLAQYDQINEKATLAYRQGTSRVFHASLAVTVFIVLVGLAAALILAARVVKPLEKMTRRINSLSGEDSVFAMEDSYRTGDEIEILAKSFASVSAKSREYVGQITRITAEKERIGTELALATRIQADMLPSIYPAFPDRSEFDIYAAMDPAKEVGGDFYDYFLVDDDHLCMVMADVSGKGVPAALFMMASKIILANNAMMKKSPAQILND
ncbi:MAG: SpoIIE family protein phosphatase, partial [Clostridia bacterium]|nr:SpoIIE family protein phosphatase [Clostridia bacterium]